MRRLLSLSAAFLALLSVAQAADAPAVTKVACVGDSITQGAGT